jgi:molecular chaperone HscB
MQLLHLPSIPFPATSPSGPCPRASFIIPISNIRREFLQIQSQHHPFEPTHSKALALFALINNPYKPFSDRFSVQYLL